MTDDCNTVVLNDHSAWQLSYMQHGPMTNDDHYVFHHINTMIIIQTLMIIYGHYSNDERDMSQFYVHAEFFPNLDD
ncbi:hypothetical protein BLA29_003404 [Euroglyphus maynei]|uniref:Uncharacterized protein n=1 Tax=Euroglyphus maynei TaxID=6958 RepID=A0A1Y3BU39_EURMA|nr:hypothetical protein BLA29_003404 [Euroglyphus maynei]